MLAYQRVIAHFQTQKPVAMTVRCRGTFTDPGIDWTELIGSVPGIEGRGKHGESLENRGTYTVVLTWD